MATSSERQSLTCPICLDIFDDPRLLPHCHHTFCVKCIQGVADSHPGRSFPCPSCREPTTLPSGGAAALRKNFYIKSEDLVNARKGHFNCSVHSDQKLDMYCDDCLKELCLKCAITKHNQHTKRDLSEAAIDAKSQLKGDKDRLAIASSTIERKIQLTEKQLRALLDKKSAVERNIRNRHASVVAAADTQLEETLSDLNETCVILESCLTADLDSEKHNKKYLQHLQTKLQDVLDKNIDCNLLDVAKDMKDGQGSRTNISKLMPEDRDTVDIPVLRCNALEAEDMVRHIEEYFGSVQKIEMKVRKGDRTKTERFGITEKPDSEVFSMCVTENGNVTISYTPHTVSNTAEEFHSDGFRKSTFPSSRGNTTFKSAGKISIQYRQQDGLFTTFSKSKAHFSLHYNLSSGTGFVKKTILKTAEPYTAEDKAEFTILCCVHRAFDVDSTSRYFVIVEESTASDEERKVRLFKRPKTIAREDQAANTGGPAVSDISYSSPCQPFKPADVCFYKKGHTEVLLIADEINDAIHVVRVMPFKLDFAGYLCPGHPLLVQPTALTVDSRNRLWVACRGRVILIVEPDLPLSYFTFS